MCEVGFGTTVGIDPAGEPASKTLENAWPDVNATKGIRSVDDIIAAQAAGQALPTINSNFFLFFGSRELHQH